MKQALGRVLQGLLHSCKVLRAENSLANVSLNFSDSYAVSMICSTLHVDHVYVTIRQRFARCLLSGLCGCLVGFVQGCKVV